MLRGPVRVTAHVERLAAGVTLELARTILTGADVAAAVAGDVVVFDGVAHAKLDGTWPASLRVGDFGASASLASDGSFVMAGPFLQVEESMSMSSRDETTPNLGRAAVLTCGEDSCDRSGGGGRRDWPAHASR